MGRGGKGKGGSCLLITSVFTIKNGVGSSRGLEAKGGLRTEEKVGVSTLMPTHFTHATIQSGTWARALLGSQSGGTFPVSSAECIMI